VELLPPFYAAVLQVLFLYNHIDDFVMKNLGDYEKRKFISIDQANVDSENKDNKEDEDKSSGAGQWRSSCCLSPCLARQRRPDPVLQGHSERPCVLGQGGDPFCSPHSHGGFR
jgi:hypothetical protein